MYMALDLGRGAIAVFMAGFTIVLVLLILAQVRSVVADVDGITVSNTATWTAAYNATNTLISAVALFATFMTLVVITIVGMILLGYIGAIGFGSGGGGGRGRRSKK